MKKFIFLSFFFLQLSIVLIAQDSTKNKWNFAIGIDINRSIYKNSSSTSLKYESDYGLGSAIGVIYNIDSIFSFNSGITYQNLNYNVNGYTSNYSNSSKDTKQSFHFLQIPLGIGIKMGKYFIFDFNPSYSLLIDAVEKGDFIHGADLFGPPPYVSYKKHEQHNITEKYLQSSFDLNLGITLKLFKLFRKDIAFSIKGTKGLLDIAKKDPINSYGDASFVKGLVSFGMKIIL